MPGFLLHFGATVQCAHLGTAQPTVVQPRVLLSGQPAVTVLSPYVVAGCSLTPSGSPFCATAQFTTGATRLLSMGQPLLLMDSLSTSVATATPLLPLLAQTRVTGM
jgi:hypothetical protein